MDLKYSNLFYSRCIFVNNEIIANISKSDFKNLEITDLYNYSSSKLPFYSLPDQIVVLKIEIGVTLNGKVFLNN